MPYLYAYFYYSKTNKEVNVLTQSYAQRIISSAVSNGRNVKYVYLAEICPEKNNVRT